ncbi:MAG: flagellar hook-associated protein 3 FlgL [Candidatus Azotimanducaceae bacterium]|jgi:flagellar hook-associated protein 3 FlgL
MRVSTVQTFNNGVNNMQRVSGLAADTQRQISTGRKFLSPSDDPVAATRILQLNQELASRDQFKQNITAVTNRLSLEETVLTGVTNVLQRIRELSVQSGAGSLNASDRKSLALEVKVRTDEMLGLLNTRDSNGEYLFSGHKGSVQPFVNGGGGSYKFVGDEGERLVQIASGTFIASRDSGKSIFEDVRAFEKTFVTNKNPRNTANPPASINVGQVADQAAFDAFHPEDAYIVFEPVEARQPPSVNYTVRRKSDNRVVDGLQNEAFVAGAKIEFQGLSVRISGTPDVGDSFLVESTSKQSVLTTMGRFAEGMSSLDDSFEGRAQIDSLVAQTLENLDNAQSSIQEARSRIGGRLNTLESTQNMHEDVELLSQEVLSQLQDVDFAEAVSRLSLETFILEASQQSFARIANLSLFNSL